MLERGLIQPQVYFPKRTSASIRRLAQPTLPNVYDAVRSSRARTRLQRFCGNAQVPVSCSNRGSATVLLFPRMPALSLTRAVDTRNDRTTSRRLQIIARDVGLPAKVQRATSARQADRPCSGPKHFRIADCPVHASGSRCRNKFCPICHTPPEILGDRFDHVRRCVDSPRPPCRGRRIIVLCVSWGGFFSALFPLPKALT